MLIININYSNLNKVNSTATLNITGLADVNCTTTNQTTTCIDLFGDVTFTATNNTQTAQTNIVMKTRFFELRYDQVTGNLRFMPCNPTMCGACGSTSSLLETLPNNYNLASSSGSCAAPGTYTVANGPWVSYT